MQQISRRQRAMDNFRAGYNCAQSVVLAFSDLLPLEEEVLSRLSCSFGGGMGRLREVCGSMSGSFLVLGLLYGYDGPETGPVKNAHYARVQELARRFEERNGSIVCRDLLGLKQKHDVPTAEQRTEEYYRKRPCGELIGTAAELLEQYIMEHPSDIIHQHQKEAEMHEHVEDL